MKAHDDRFQQLRALWPRPNTGMPYAEKKFVALKPSAELFAEMLEAMTWQGPAYLARARRRGTETIPHLSTWINQRRWEDLEVDGYTKPAEDAATARAGCKACNVVKSYHAVMEREGRCPNYQE